MIKKITLIFCILFLFSCGKKADPEYQTEKNNVLTNYRI